MATPKHLRAKPKRDTDSKWDGYVVFRKAHPNEEKTLYQAVPFRDENGNRINHRHFFPYSIDTPGFDIDTVDTYLNKGYEPIEICTNASFERRYQKGLPRHMKQALDSLQREMKRTLPKYLKDLESYKPGVELLDTEDGAKDPRLEAEAKRLKEAAHKTKANMKRDKAVAEAQSGAQA